MKHRVLVDINFKSSLFVVPYNGEQISERWVEIQFALGAAYVPPLRYESHKTDSFRQNGTRDRLAAQVDRHVLPNAQDDNQLLAFTTRLHPHLYPLNLRHGKMCPPNLRLEQALLLFLASQRKTRGLGDLLAAGQQIRQVAFTQQLALAGAHDSGILSNIDQPLITIIRNGNMYDVVGVITVAKPFIQSLLGMLRTLLSIGKPDPATYHWNGILTT